MEQLRKDINNMNICKEDDPDVIMYMNRMNLNIGERHYHGVFKSDKYGYYMNNGSILLKLDGKENGNAIILKSGVHEFGTYCEYKIIKKSNDFMLIPIDQEDKEDKEDTNKFILIKKVINNSDVFKYITSDSSDYGVMILRTGYRPLLTTKSQVNYKKIKQNVKQTYEYCREKVTRLIHNVFQS